MQSRIPVCLAIGCIGLAVAISGAADEPKKDQLTYVEKGKYPVIEEMEERNDELRKAAEAKTEEIIAQIK
ncbi:MAG: hypothetical protein QNL88_09510, partial [Acidobacteriota bacterium]|nr:hypothetical protein [Acidobacteriota bacterium]